MNQQRCCERREHALDGAPPLGVFRTHLQKFARERQDLFGNSHLVGEVGADTQEIAVDVRSSVAQFGEFLFQGLCTSSCRCVRIVQLVAHVSWRWGGELPSGRDQQLREVASSMGHVYADRRQPVA